MEASTAFLLLSMAAFVVGILSLLAMIVLKIRKKPLKKVKIVAVIAPIGGAALFALFFVFSQRESEQRVQETLSTPRQIQTEIDFEVCDSEEDLELETYYEHESTSKNRVSVYDSEYLYKIFGTEQPTREQLLQAVEDNDQISEKFRPLLELFIERLCEKQPDAERRTLYHNLQSLQVVECTRDEYISKSLDLDSYGCYVRTENTIYVLKDHDYIEGTWDFQVIFHELCHALRLADFEENGTKYTASPGLYSSDTLTDEALNSVFAVSLFDYEERDIAYQTASNYLTVMLECMDNYEITDYTTHSQSYFYAKLDEATGYHNYAATIWRLIDLQREDSTSDKIEIPKEQYDPIIDYLCEMYYKKYITADKSREEAEVVADALLEKVCFDMPDAMLALVDTQRFYDDLDGYVHEA